MTIILRGEIFKCWRKRESSAKTALDRYERDTN